MNVRNHVLAHRPLVGGIAVFNPSVGTLGTIGAILKKDDGSADRWLLTCHHVLARSDTPLVPDEPVFQPWGTVGVHTPIGKLDADHFSVARDCATAKLVDHSDCESWILGIGHPAAPMEPVEGMRVLKSGIATGMTEGRVTRVGGEAELVEIRRTSGAPSGYDLAGIGDSGAVWVDAETRAPVVLHRASSEGGDEFALGYRFSVVLDAIGLVLA